jgi:site-specific recombinase XerD
MNTAAEQKLEVSDVSAWVALYHRASTVPSTPLVSQEVYIALVDGVSDLRDKAIILVLMESGLRASELVLLDRDMITIGTHTLPDGSVETIATGSVPSTNGGHERHFFLSARAVKAVCAYLRAKRNDDTSRVLFSNRHGGRLGAPLIRNMLSGWCDRLGIERFGLHEFRRTLAARLCEGGCDLRAIKSALGYVKTEALIDVLPPLDIKVN